MKKITVIFLSVTMIAAMASAQNLAYNPLPAEKDAGIEEKCEGTWKVLPNIPNAQLGPASVVLNGKFHVIGGAKAILVSSDDHQVYDPATNTWEQKAKLPIPAGWAGTTVYDGKIYSFGGDTLGYQIGGGHGDYKGEINYYTETDRAFVYDPETDSWTELAPLPARRSYHAAITVGDYIYIFGSRSIATPGKPLEMSTWRYDPVADSYTRLADIPENAMYVMRAHYNGYIYAIAGSSAGTGDQGVFKYNIARDTWEILDIQKILPRTWTLSQNSDAAVYQCTKLLILGGWYGARSPMATYFDMETETFGQMPSMPQGRCCAATGVIDDNIYVAGGFWDLPDDVEACLETWGYFPDE